MTHDQHYSIARNIFAEYNVDTEAALNTLATIPISLHCWQGDDVAGFESTGAAISEGGLQATGNYPGKARSIQELRADLDQALALIPGKHRLNLHAIYGDFGENKPERNQLEIAHFQSWIDWAKLHGIGLDFNPTYFAHPHAKSGLTLAHRDPAIRHFWIEHGICCRRIGAEMGRQLNSVTVTNTWIPDGSKEVPIDRLSPRERLMESLDAVLKEMLDSKFHRDAVESKLFGIGSESYVVGSHEFYLGYAAKKQVLYCLDSGHFHPTENLADKISSLFLFVPELLLHVSRGVRWDSDHVVLHDDATSALMQELVRGNFLARTHIGLDYFDASINRIAAWVIGTRNTLKALLCALLEPTELLRKMELEGEFTGRLAMLEEVRSLPWGAVWKEYLHRHNVADQFMPEIRQYEATVLAKR